MSTRKHPFHVDPQPPVGPDTHHEPLPTPLPRQQEPEFDSRGTWQAYQREHYQWRTGLTPATDRDIPADEGTPASPTAAQVAAEVLLGILGSGPGVSIGKGARPGIGRPVLRPAPSQPPAGSRPAPAAFRPPIKPVPARAVETPVSVSNALAPAKTPHPAVGGKQSVWSKLSRAHRSTGWRSRHARKPAQASNGSGESSLLEGLLQQRANSNTRSIGQLESIADLRALDFEVPGRVYRAHQGDTVLGDAKKGLQRAPGGNLDGDDYLAAIIKHSARQGGSAGEVLSLSADKGIANKFARGRKAPVFEIDTTQDPKGFRTMTDILLKDSERLVLGKKVTRATVLNAADNIAVHQESEVFYVNGDVPPDFLVFPDLSIAIGG
jgi:hypothetical protein